MVRCVLKRLEYILKYDSHFKFSSQHNFGEGGGEFIQYDHLMCTRIFPLYYEQDNCRSSKNHEESGMASICIY